MHIRKYRHNDHHALISLWQTVFPNSAPHNDPANAISQKLAVDDLIYVVEDGGLIIGACMAGYDGHRGWLYAVAVLKAHRRRGTGAALVKTVLAELKKMGCTKVNLQVRADNAAVAAFYRSLGFETEERLSMGMHIS
jgi:ribosomal protein S18 acetylase RimI-like enzyme